MESSRKICSPLSHCTSGCGASMPIQATRVARPLRTCSRHVSKVPAGTSMRSCCATVARTVIWFRLTALTET
jgi:hypothetical protein